MLSLTPSLFASHSNFNYFDKRVGFLGYFRKKKTVSGAVNVVSLTQTPWTECDRDVPQRKIRRLWGQQPR